MEKHTLHELNEYIRRILALNLPEPLWISAEIAQLNESRGHYFLSLVQKGKEDSGIIAQSDAVIWQRQYRQLRRSIGSQLHALLQPGMEVLVRAQVDFHERYGLKLIIHDIDPAYTLGQLEMRRRAILERLQAEKLIGKNRRHALPAVLQRIAIISSERAAGLQDFLQQLQQNAYGYQFQCRLFPAAVQGELVEKEVQQQLRKIERQRARFDGVAIIRGGGARLDLAAFDSYELCKAVAESPLPVLTGIGHEVDEVLLDKVAHSPLKTPTAVADLILHHNMQFEASIQQLGQQLQWLARHKLKEEALGLERLEQNLRHRPPQALKRQRELLRRIEEDIPRWCRQKIKAEKQQLNQLEQAGQLLSLEATLRRGFTITTKNGKAIRSVKSLSPGDHITTRFEDGSTESEVK